MDASLVLALGPDEGAALGALVADPPPVPLAVAADPGLLDETRRASPRLAAALAGLDVEWVRTGWGADLSLLPTATVRALLDRESGILAALDLAAPGLWLRGADPCVLDVLPSEVEFLLLEGIARPGVVARHATVLPALPVGSAVRIVDRPAGLPAGAGPTPGRRVADDPPTGALPWPAPPAPPGSPLARRLARTAALARPAGGVLAALAAAARPGAAETEAVRVRGLVDAAAHRRDEWTAVTTLDWDADGRPDVEIETSRLSLVVDPAQSLAVHVLDDMAAATPLAAPGGYLCRTDGEPVAFAAGRWEHSRTAAVVPFAGDRVACRLGVERSTLTLTYRLGEGEPLRLGPDLRLRGLPAVRVDGSPWRRSAAASVSGHRLRLDFGDRHLLVSSRLPSTFDVEAAAGVTTLRVHREVAGGGSYEVTVDVSAPRTERSDA